MKMIETTGLRPGNTGNNDLDIIFNIGTLDDRIGRCESKHLYYPGESPRHDVDHTLFTAGPAPEKATNHGAARIHVRGAKRAVKGK